MIALRIISTDLLLKPQVYSKPAQLILKNNELFPNILKIFKNLKSCKNNLVNLKCLENFLYKSPRRKTILKARNLAFATSFFGPTLLLTDQHTELAKKKEKQIKSKKANQKKSGTDISFIVKGFFILYEGFRTMLRALRLGITFFPLFITYPVTYLGTVPQDLWWTVFVKVLEFSGPIFIKFGQWASTRRDLFSDCCCSHLSKLQRRTRPHSWWYTKKRMEKSFGKNWRKIFVKFDNQYEPVGSGCVAQVYKVWMSTDAIEDKEILGQIMEDDYELSDGFEIFGFNYFRNSKKNIEKEEKLALDEYRQQQLQKKVKEQHNISPVESFPEVVEVTDTVTENIASNKYESTETADSAQEENQPNLVEHALVEQWQQDPEALSKDLPSIVDPLEEHVGLLPVAVKVLHPGVYQIFRRDLSILTFSAKFITTVYPPLRWIALPKCVEEFSKIMAAQIDLRIEAKNLEAFSESFSRIEYVRFPSPIRPYVSRSVLVETYEDGEPMLNFLNSDEPAAIKKNLSKFGVDMLLKMIFEDNFVHGDLHPGNILVQNKSLQGTSGNEQRLMMVDVGADCFVMDIQPDPNPLRICVLDCGIVATLTPEDLENLKAVFTQVVLGDGGSVADLFLENSDNHCENPDMFRADMIDLIDSARKNSISLSQVDVGVLLQNLLGLLMRHQVRLESAMSSIVLAVFVLEGLGRSLDPDMDILERARPILVTQTT